jgi:hypothetical protein
MIPVLEWLALPALLYAYLFYLFLHFTAPKPTDGNRNTTTIPMLEEDSKLKDSEQKLSSHRHEHKIVVIVIKIV